jgi:hypothetical protein
MTGNGTSYFTRMKYFGKCAKEKDPPAGNERAFFGEMGLALPAQLEGELELPRIVGRSGLTGETS